jgi:hypothetical protein
MKSVLKIQLTFNAIEYPASLLPLLDMPPSIRARFCKQVLELFFREGGARDGTWPVRTPSGVMGVGESRGQQSALAKAEPEGSIAPEMFDDSFASYFQ